MEAAMQNEKRPTDEPLRRSVDQAVPPKERLPTAADENPISERVREAGEDPKPSPDDLAVQGGNRIEGA
jgi:hypothetical protein